MLTLSGIQTQRHTSSYKRKYHQQTFVNTLNQLPTSTQHYYQHFIHLLFKDFTVSYQSKCDFLFY